MRLITYLRLEFKLEFGLSLIRTVITSFYNVSDLSSIVGKMFNRMLTEIESPVLDRSGFTISRMMDMDVEISQHNLGRGRRVDSYIPPPQRIRYIGAYINPKSRDDKCFKWAVITSRHSHEIRSYPQRVSTFRR